MPYLLLLRGAMGAGKSAVAENVHGLSPETALIEIDEIKEKKYGTTERCNPLVDFREAGRQAKQAMDAGHDAIVIESLCDQQHIACVLDGAGLTEYSANVLSIWLQCSLETALARKTPHFQATVVKSQHHRYASRYSPENEMIIHTDTVSAADVAAQVLQFLQRGGETAS